MAIQYIDDGTGAALQQFFGQFAKRLAEPQTRLKQLTEDPETIKSLAPAYRAAVKSGTEDAFFKGLRVKREDLEPLFSAYPASPQEKMMDEFEAQGGFGLELESKLAELKAGLAKSKIGMEAIAGYEDYIKNLPDSPLGKQLKSRAGLAIANPGFLNYIERLEAAEAKAASDGSGGSDEDPMIRYNRWRQAYDADLKEFREAKGDAKIQAMRNLNTTVLLGTELIQEGKVPPFEITGVREAEGFFGIGKKLEEYNITPKVRDSVAIAAQMVLSGKGPNGEPASLDQLKESNLWKSLSKDDQNRALAAIAAQTSEEETNGGPGPRTSFMGILGGILSGVGRDAANVATAPVRGAGRLAIGTAEAAIRGSGSRDPLSAIRENPTPTPPTASEDRQPHARLAKWAEGKGFTVTGRNERTGHNADSTHYRNLAIDVRTRDKTNEEIEKIIRDATLRGVRVIDERKRPAGQKVWSGPHLHMEIDPRRARALKMSEEEYAEYILRRLEM